MTWRRKLFSPVNQEPNCSFQALSSSVMASSCSQHARYLHFTGLERQDFLL